MKIEKLDQPRGYRPECEHRVKVAAGQTMTRSVRDWKNERKGRDADLCPAKADFMVDGKPMCRAHAGQAALHHLMGTQGT